MLFKGNLNISDNEECVICLEVKRCTDQPNCEHKICIQCLNDVITGIDLEHQPHFHIRKLKMNITMIKIIQNGTEYLR